MSDIVYDNSWQTLILTTVKIKGYIYTSAQPLKVCPRIQIIIHNKVKTMLSAFGKELHSRRI